MHVGEDIFFKKKFWNKACSVRGQSGRIHMTPIDAIDAPSLLADELIQFPPDTEDGDGGSQIHARLTWPSLGRNRRRVVLGAAGRRLAGLTCG